MVTAPAPLAALALVETCTSPLEPVEPAPLLITTLPLPPSPLDVPSALSTDTPPLAPLELDPLVTVVRPPAPAFAAPPAMSTEPPRASMDDAPADDPAVMTTAPPLLAVSADDAPAEMLRRLPAELSPLVLPTDSTMEPLMPSRDAPVDTEMLPDDAESPVEMVCEPDEPVAAPAPVPMATSPVLLPSTPALVATVNDPLRPVLLVPVNTSICPPVPPAAEVAPAVMRT